MNLGISFAPLVPSYVVWAAFAVAALISVILLIARSRGAPLRALALALMVLALANPSLTREDREPIPSVAAVIVDKSPSQDFGDRAQQTEAARATLVERLKRIPGLEVRVAEAGAADGETDGTKLFAALSSTLADVPPDRVAGAVLITDGRVHDVPADASTLGFSAPLHGRAARSFCLSRRRKAAGLRQAGCSLPRGAPVPAHRETFRRSQHRRPEDAIRQHTSA